MGPGFVTFDASLYMVEIRIGIPRSTILDLSYFYVTVSQIQIKSHDNPTQKLTIKGKSIEDRGRWAHLPTCQTTSLVPRPVG